MDASEGGGELVLERSEAFRDRFRRYKVLLDGEPVGSIAAGEGKVWPLSAGTHELQLKIDWKGSQVERFEIAPGQKQRFACGGKKVSATIVDLFRRSEAWIQLDRLDG